MQTSGLRQIAAATVGWKNKAIHAYTYVSLLCEIEKLYFSVFPTSPICRKPFVRSRPQLIQKTIEASFIFTILDYLLCYLQLMIKLKNIIYSNCFFLFVYQIKFVQSWCPTRIRDIRNERVNSLSL